MKEEILQLLRNNDQYRSGEDISRLLGVSRTAVWKQINALKAEGYVIESQTKLGYRLVQVPDRLYPREIQKYLYTGSLGRNICYRAAVGSTNHLAKEMAEQGCAEGLVAVAEQQTAGKGRLGRSWHSPFATGIWMSAVLKPPISPADAPQITLLTAVAVARAITGETGVPARIKWPNDILVQGKKLCGILTELKADMDFIHYVIVGIGINVNEESFAEEIRETATSLSQETGRRLNRAKITAAVLDELEKNYLTFLREGFAPIRNEWKQLSLNLGRDVTVHTVNETIRGTAFDLGEEGMLLVREAGGKVRKIVAGDVSLR